VQNEIDYYIAENITPITNEKIKLQNKLVQLESLNLTEMSITLLELEKELNNLIDQ